MDNEAPGALAAGPDRRGDAAVTDLSGKRKSFAPWIIALVFVGVTIAIFASGVHRYLSFSTLVTYQDSLHDMVARNPAVAPLLFVLAYALVVAFSIPGAVVLTVTSGFLFGGILGTMLTLTGATIGVAGIYAIAGSALGPAVKRLVEGRLASINEGFREGVWSYLFFLRLVPLFPFWVVNLATACLQVPLVPLLVTTFLGTLPATLAFSFAGASFAEIVRSQGEALRTCQASGATTCGVTFDASHVISPQILATFVALGVMALVPVAMKTWRRRSKSVGKF